MDEEAAVLHLIRLILMEELVDVVKNKFLPAVHVKFS